MITILKCPTCNKTADVIESKLISNKLILEKYKCGHNKIIKVIEEVKSNKPLLKSLTGSETFPFQDIGINFAIKNGSRVLIADEMGLGKTIQAIGTIKLQREKLLPAIVICKSIAKYNWLREFLNWLNAGAIPQIIETSSDTWYESFPIHICSYDMIRIHLTSKKEERVRGKIKKIPLDVEKIFNRANCIVLDECHYIKNDTAQRTVAIKTLCKSKSHIIALSGTPIKNNAGEYFPVLNILHPGRFNNKTLFLTSYCDSMWNGYTYKTGGLKNPEYFKSKTEDFIIRREMADVLPDLPEVRRNNSFVIMSDKVEVIYDKAWKEFTQCFEKYGDRKTFEAYSDILVKINVLRQITGIAKVDAAAEFIEEFLTGTDRKITLFTHHIKVAELLEIKINEMIDMLNKDLGMNIGHVLKLRAQDKDNVEKIIEDFKKPLNRVLIASTLAAGESINLQFCSDCLLVERQWNPANEEQAAVGRFKRIGQVNSIGLNYLLVAGTIDDYFTELVEQKRQIFNETMRGQESLSNWNEQSIVMELAEILAREGRKKFQL